MISPALKDITTPGRGDHSNGAKISQHLCFGTGKPYLDDVTLEPAVSKTLQALVAIACIVVIAAGGWWMMDRRAELAEEEKMTQIAEEVRDDAQLDRCKRDVANWDAGNQNTAQTRFGEGAEAGIDLCRNLIKLDEIRKSKPSEQPE